MEDLDAALVAFLTSARMLRGAMNRSQRESNESLGEICRLLGEAIERTEAIERDVFRSHPGGRESA